MKNSKKIELIIWSIFSIALILSVILTYLLLYQIIPSNLGPLYILFGTMMVTILGIHLNRKLEEEKQAKKIKRILSLINASMKVNTDRAEEYISVLDNIPKEKDWNLKFKPINVNYWDILRFNIIYVDLKLDLVLDLIELKELIGEINNYLTQWNEFINKYESGIFDEENSTKFNYLNNTLKTRLKEFIEKSKLYLKTYDFLTGRTKIE